MISTEAYVITSGPARSEAVFKLGQFRFDPPNDTELLVRPIYGCWEGNMGHALTSIPVDICRVRGESGVVLGNAGVFQVEKVGQQVEGWGEGDFGMVCCVGDVDDFGYPKTIFGYDARNTIGLLARKTKLRPDQAIRISPDSKYSLKQWAAFSLRYITAWSNWHTAFKCWSAQSADKPTEHCIVFGWGGGVSFAEVTLARLYGCRAYMMTSRPKCKALLESAGVTAVERPEGGSAQLETTLMETMEDLTEGRRVDILIDNLGLFYRTSMRLLSRRGVITTSGWKFESTFPVLRPQECINRHVHVYTHYACYSEGVAAMKFAEQAGWMPPIDDEVIWAWEDVPRLADDYARGSLSSLFPIYAVNEVMK
jgi:NADPH:quinone reductase-like Zn-dependent oxidoreductase